MLAILMLIVDAQIHLWNAGNPTSPWHRQIPAYLKEDALKEMDAGGVDAAILTPHTPWDPNANELCMEAARAHPDRFAILGNFPLDKPESRALVDTWKQRPGMLGCRFTFIGPEQSKWPSVDNIKPILSHDPPGPRVFPPGLPCHSRAPDTATNERQGLWRDSQGCAGGA